MAVAEGGRSYYRRRRRLVLAAAATMLILVVYTGSGISTIFLVSTGWIPRPIAEVMLVAFEPLNSYAAAGLPGSEPIREMASWAREAGRRFDKQ